jgi:hypothetical protein
VLKSLSPWGIRTKINKPYKQKKNRTIINPHVNFNCNAEEEFTFYKSVFGGDFAMIMRFKTYQILNFKFGKTREIK